MKTMSLIITSLIFLIVGICGAWLSCAEQGGGLEPPDDSEDGVIELVVLDFPFFNTNPVGSLRRRW